MPPIKPSWQRKPSKVKARHMVNCLRATLGVEDASRRITFAGYFVHRKTCHGYWGDIASLLRRVDNGRWKLMASPNAEHYRQNVVAHRELMITELLLDKHLHQLPESLLLQPDTPLDMVMDWVQECEQKGPHPMNPRVELWRVPSGEVINVPSLRAWMIRILQLVYNMGRV